jgi:hypothetical protein
VLLHAETPNIPPLIKAGLLHVQFENIHPFLDGKGTEPNFQNRAPSPFQTREFDWSSLAE